MQLQQRNGAIAATWIVAAGLVGVVGNVTSIGGAALIFAFGLMPPILMMLRWSEQIPERALPDTAASGPPPRHRLV